MQRLRRLRQLAGSEYVYPGANHTRFEHCVGVMYLAGKVLENPNISRVVNDEEAEVARIAALLHDVGHGPFSHVFEHLLVRDLDKTHEDITSWLIEKSEVADKLSKMGYRPEEISKLAVGKLHKPGRAFLDQIISSAVDVDKQDFIVRDTYHTGAEYGFIDVFRLIHALDVLGENLAVELGALSALGVLHNRPHRVFQEHLLPPRRQSSPNHACDGDGESQRGTRVNRVQDTRRVPCNG